MRNFLGVLIVVCVVSLALGGCGKKDAGPARRLHEKEGGFSYDPPEGWKIVEFPGLKYRISHRDPVGGFAANINVVDEVAPLSLEEYVDANVETMGNAFADMKLLGRTALETEDGEPSVKLVTERHSEGALLRQTYYFFDGGRRKFVVTCTAPASDGASLDPVFDASMKTFRLH
jgi:hypothetical protein